MFIITGVLRAVIQSKRNYRGKLFDVPYRSTSFPPRLPAGSATRRRRHTRRKLESRLRGCPSTARPG